VSKIEINMCGKPCPAPVVETKKAIDKIQEGIVTVLVDNEVSKNNVERFAKKTGCSVDIEQEKGIFKITITKGFTCEVNYVETETLRNNEKSYLLYMKNNVMGHGDKELGNILIKAFFKTLIDNEDKPETIVFVNKGVFLVLDDSPVINELKILNEQFNIEIVACGTCLDYYNLKEKLAVGFISNMFDIQNFLINADKIVTP